MKEALIGTHEELEDIYMKTIKFLSEKTSENKL